jgi:hypothetical protein
VGPIESMRDHARRVGAFMQDVGFGLLITHSPGGKLAAWPLRAATHGGTIWSDAQAFPLRVVFDIPAEPDLIRQVAECPRVIATFQHGHRYCYLAGLAQVARKAAYHVLEMDVQTAHYRELVEVADPGVGSLDASRRA